MYNKKPNYDEKYIEGNLSYMKFYELQEYFEENEKILEKMEPYSFLGYGDVVARETIRPFHYFQEDWRNQSLTEEQNDQIREWLDNNWEIEQKFIKFCSIQKNIDTSRGTLSEYIDNLKRSQALLFLRLIDDGFLEIFLGEDDQGSEEEQED